MWLASGHIRSNGQELRHNNIHVMGRSPLESTRTSNSGVSIGLAIEELHYTS